MKTPNLLILVVSFAIMPTLLSSQDSFTLQLNRYDLTFNHISYFALIEGDDNLNSELSIRYQREDSNVWLESAPAMRAHPSQVVDGAETGLNYHAASVMFLDPGEVVDLEITITDPDGPSYTHSITLRTRELPRESDYVVTRYVAPGSGGGSGTLADPYLGLQTAADNAEPADKFIVADGMYEAFNLFTSGQVFNEIVFVAENQHGAIINGNGTDRGIITLGEFDSSISDIIIDGFIIQNGAWGIDAQNSSYITVRNNIIRNVDYAYYNRRENGFENNQYITNNLITGRIDWISSGSEIPDSRAIDLRGNNNVVSHNTIMNFGDAISTDGPPYGGSFSMDIHNNDIMNMVDDFIEVDGTVANTRIYANRGYNGRSGISLAPIYGGPCYVFRNALYNMDISAFKMNRSPAGLFIAHNTTCKTDNGTSSPAGWQNTRLYNNIMYGTRYVFEEYGLVDGSIDIWDYNAYNSSRTSDPWYKWDNVRYDNIEALRTGAGIEANGIEISLGDLISVDYPTEYYREYTADDHDLQLSPFSAAYNSGTQISNINLPFVFDGMPDRGAFEVDGYTPDFGHDFDLVSSNVDMQLSSQFLLYPNPTTSFTRVDGPDEYPIEKILVLDNTGKLIETSYEQSIDFSDYKAGVYYLQIVCSGKQIQKKLVYVK